ncbi:MAG: ATP-binding protein [Pseudomonadota bacterium]
MTSMQPDLRTILLRDNPWLGDSKKLQSFLTHRIPKTFVPRLTLGKSCQRWQEIDRAHLVVGPRQAGKSTALWAYLAEQGYPCLFIDCEQFLVQKWCESAPLFLKGLEEFGDRPVTLFFDEVQHLAEAGLFIKGLVDRRVGIPILVTGSSSFHLGARTRETLAGRATRTRLLPFSFEEVCQDLEALPEIVRAEKIESRFERHLVWGGYPAVWLAQEPESVLADLVDAVILRDASDLFRINRPDAFRTLLQLVAGQVGSLVNYAEWSAILGISRDTVASYIHILEQAHVVVSLPPFVGGRRAELTSRPKIFFVDNGLRNQLCRNMGPFTERADAGPVLENWVYTELLKRIPAQATVHYWRSSSGAEVDFVIVLGDKRIGIEVKAQHLHKPRLSRGSRSFIDAYRPQLFLLVNLSLQNQKRIGDTEVRWITPANVAQTVTMGLFRGNEDE